MLPAARWLFGLWAASVLAAAWAQWALRPLPPLLRTVSDEVGILSDEEGAKLSAALQEILEQTSVRTVMVIAETTRPESIPDYAERLARRWLQERGVDPTRTIFVIVSLKDREMQVMPGRALGLDQAMHREDPTILVAPLFREERYFEGLMVLMARIREIIEKNPPPKAVIEGPNQ